MPTNTVPIFWMRAQCGTSFKPVLGFKHISGPVDQCLNDSSVQFHFLFTSDADDICQPKKGFASIPTRTSASGLEKVI